MYEYAFRKSVERDFRKLARKDPMRLRQIHHKILEVCQETYRFKPLRRPLQNLRRVHIDPYVIIFSIDEAKGLVIIEDYDHHDNVYK